jgi:hypothetical protein
VSPGGWMKRQQGVRVSCPMRVMMIAAAALLAWGAVVWVPRVVFSRAEHAGTHLSVTIRNTTDATVPPLDVAVGVDRARIPAVAAGRSIEVRLDSPSSGDVVLIDPSTGGRSTVFGAIPGDGGVMGRLEVGLVGIGANGTAHGYVNGVVTRAPHGPVYDAGSWVF